MSERISHKLYSATQAHKIIQDVWQQIKAGLTAGHKYTLIIEPENKSYEQQKKFHAIIGEIAQQAQHLGSKWDAEDWKRLLVQSFYREQGLDGGRIVPSLDGQGIVQLDFQTRRFSKERASQFIEWLQAWAAQNGVELSE